MGTGESSKEFFQKGIGEVDVDETRNRTSKHTARNKEMEDDR